ncbi:hypothetical protein JCM19231_1974 [Vibrio ishigakensis]|uniref:Uncharacterized protein n=1 Tax=Vibrio ishigakensis TaxID=1481914 RepID=A0A0B8NVL1_9VIBR|nr:hypothetical protein JCM19231_1974 [Vibrio ishigakensis]
MITRADVVADNFKVKPKKSLISSRQLKVSCSSLENKKNYQGWMNQNHNSTESLNLY